MSIIKRWRGHNERDREHRGLTKQRREDRALDSMRDEMDRAFDSVWKDFDRDPFSALAHLPERLGRVSNWPALDMSEDDEAVTLRLDVPGLDAKDVDVEISGNQLSIRGQRQDESKEEKKGVHRRERYSGSFVRTVTLPSYVDAGKAEAKYDKGTLMIRVPKMPGQGPRRVRVKP